jgi:hypothetical protein
MRRKADRATGAGDGTGALEIEFEDDDAAPAPEYAGGAAGRSRDLRPIAMATLSAAVLGAALWASHGQPSGGPSVTGTLASEHNYAASVVTVAYEGSRLLSQAQRQIEIDLRVAPVEGAKVRIIDYYISENGVQARADPPPSMTPLPTSGMDVKLDVTVTDCAVVPIGETMAFVDVVADGPVGIMDRFTILGDRYSADLAQMLGAVCPGRQTAGRGPVAVVGTATASGP